ncbi:MAG: TrmH family RNA methyltransferase [Anaerolineales bacterium]
MPSLILAGAISVLAALEAGRRDIKTIYLQREKSIRNAGALRKLASAAAVPIEEVDGARIDELVGNIHHGGVAVLVGERRYQDLQELISGKKEPFIAMLEGIEDPYNFGQAIRALYAAGAEGLVVPERNWDSALAVVTRASAGASEYIPTARIAEASEAITYFKSHGFRVAATAKEKNSVSIYAVDLHGPLFLLIGGERRGLTAADLASCDILLSIPYGRDFKAELDVTSATAVLAFEVMRQRVWPHRQRRQKS